MPNEDKLRQVYETLKKETYTLPEYERFVTDMDDDNKLRQVYETLKKETYTLPEYAQFKYDMGKATRLSEMRDAAFSAGRAAFGTKKEAEQPANTQQPASATPAETETSATENETPANAEAEEPTTTTPTPPASTRPLSDAERTVMSINLNRAAEQFRRNKQAFDERMKSVNDYYKSGLSVNGLTVNGGLGYNPESGQLEQTYITPTGKKTFSKAVADTESAEYRLATDNSVAAQLSRAEEEGRRLAELIKRRMHEIDEKKRAQGGIGYQILTSLGQSKGNHQLPSKVNDDYSSDAQYMQLMAAARKNRETQRILRDTLNNQKNDFWHNVYEEARTGYFLTNGDTELSDATALSIAASKIDEINRKRASGEELTAEELAAESLLKNEMAMNAVTQQYGQDYGAWGTAGKMFTNSIDFMLPIMINPFAGIAAKGLFQGVVKGGTKAIAKGVGKFASKEVAERAANNIVTKTILNATGVLVGGHGAGAVIANTSGAGFTAAGTMEGITGAPTVNDEGKMEMVDQKSFMESLAEAEREQIREMGSEMVGALVPGVGKFASKIATKGLEKLGLSRIASSLTSVGNKEWYKAYSGLLKAGGYNGIPGEVMEEYEGFLFDALTGHGEEAWKDITDLDTHIDIWLGCATTGAILGAVPFVGQGIHTARFYQAKHNYTRSGNAASVLFGDEWNNIREQIENTPNEELTAYLVDFITNHNDEENRAVMTYVRDYMKYRGFNLAAANNADTPLDEDNERLNQSYRAGYEATDPQELVDAKYNYELQREKLSVIASDDYIAEIDADPSGFLETARNDEDWNDEEKAILLDYLNARQVYEGMIQRVRDDIDGRIAASDAAIDSRVNRTTGGIIGAKMKKDTRQVYVVNGKLARYEDGNGVSTTDSDGNIVVRDAETGKLEMVSPDAILSFDEPLDPEMEKQTAAETIRQEYGQQEAAKIDGTVTSFNEGDTYTILGEDGTPVQIQIAANEDGIVDNGDGTVNATDGKNKKVFPVAKEAIQQQVDAANRARVEEREQQRIAAQQEAATETPRIEYAMGDRVTLRDEDGTLINGEIAEVSSDGLYTVDIDRPIKVNGKEYYSPQLSHEQLDGMVTSYNGQELGASQPQTEAVTEEATPAEVAPAVATEEGTAAAREEVPAEGADVAEEAAESPAMARIPKNEEGEPVFENAQVQDTWAALLDMNEGDAAEAQDTAEQMVAQAQQDLDKANKAKPKGGRGVVEIQRGKKERAANIAKAKATLDYWTQVAGYQEALKRIEAQNRKNQRRMAMSAARQAQQARGRYVKEDAAMGDYLDFEDFVMRTVATGAVKFKWSGDGATKGLGQHLFPNASNEERNRRIGFLSNEGVFPEEAAETLLQQYAEETGVGYADDVNLNGRDALDVVLDVMRSYDTPRTMIEAAMRRHEEMGLEAQEAAYYAEQEEAELEAMAAVMHMSVEEVQEYLAYIDEVVMPELSSVDDTEINGIFADAIEAEEDARALEDEAAMANIEQLNQEEENGREIQGVPPVVSEGQGQAESVGGSTEMVQGQEPAGTESSGQPLAADGSVEEGSVAVSEGEVRGAAGGLNIVSDEMDREREAKPIGRGPFGNIYDQFKGNAKEAIAFLRKKQEGEAIGALHHAEIGDIDLVWGKEGTNKSDGYGLAKLVKFHPEVLDNLQEILDEMKVVERSENRVQLESDTHQAAVRLTWDNERKIWLLTAFEKKTPASIDKTTDTGDNRSDLRGDTALSQNAGVSESKDTQSVQNEQGNEDIFAMAERIAGEEEQRRKVSAAEAEVNTTPTEAQKEAGNYKMGHVKIGQFDVTIENPKGSVRSGVDANGNRWETTMHNTYGYIRGTEGVDGDHIDVFLAEDMGAWDGANVYVVDQYNTDGTFDEHKVMLGFNSQEDAMSAYLSNYEDGWADGRRIDITGVSTADFGKWVDSSHRKTKAFAEYKSVKDATPAKTDGYEVERRYHKKNGTYIHAVKFTEQMPRDAFMALKQRVKEFGGYYSSFGKGGFIFDNEADAHKFAQAVLGQTQEEAEREPVKKVNIEGLFNSLKQDGRAKLSEHSEPLSEQKEEKPKNPSGNKLVSDERYAELRERMRKKLGGQMNIGIDPEILAIGTEMAVYHLEKGARKFAEYAKAMIDDLGDAIRPYLKSFYNGARNLPEVESEGIAADMTSYDDVQRFDVANFDKTTINAFATAETFAREAEVEKEAEVAQERIKKARAERSESQKKSVNSPQQYNLFGGLLDNVEQTNDNDNENRGTDAVRSEGLPADRYGQRGGRSTQSNSQTARQERERVDGSRPEEGERTGGEVSQGDGRPVRRISGLKNTGNNHSERGADHAPTSVDARIEANIKAIELAQQLIESGERATPEQMAVLRKFSGWGGLGKAFNEHANYTLNGRHYMNEPTPESKRLRELLGEEAYRQAVMSANSAYYTPAYVVDTLWDIAEQLGFEGGTILEGSAGIGNILGQMPTRISERSDIHAIEIDGTAGGILSLLYPDANVEIQGFEQTRIPNGSVDLAITNVPFVTGLRVNDTTGDSDLSKKFHNIHDFCIAKNVRKLREGGLGIFITSNGTLDNSKKLRDWIVSEGGSDFIGAFRMNNKTFGGTAVTSDIIVIRKRVNGQKSANAIDVSTVTGERMAEYDTGETRKVKGQETPVVKQLSMDYNSYFVEHPERMAGEMHFAFEKGDTFRPTSKGLYPVQGMNQEQMLSEFAKTFKAEEGNASQQQSSETPSYVADASADGKKLGELYVKDGQLVVASNGGYVPLSVNANKVKGHTKVECFNAYAAIKQALADVLAYQTDNESDKGLKPLLDKLNKAYDDFVKTYGHFNKNTAIAFLRNDVDFANIFALESYEETADKKGNRVQKFGKTDVFKQRVVEKEKEPSPTNVKDGIVASMFKYGRIDVPYIAEQLGETEEAVKRDIIDNGYGFENPVTRQVEVSYQYLSGNVREKLRQAEENNENGEYDRNIKALQEVVPMNIPAHLIDFTLGSSWIDPKLYDEYVKARTDIDVRFTAVGGTWFMDAPDYGLNKEKNRSMGVVSEQLHKVIMGHTLIEAAIQNKTITVSQTYRHYDGTTETVTDKEATQACAAKIDEIRQDFKDWARQKMQSDSEMSERMERIYNETFNNYVPMRIPEEFVPKYFGGASHKFKMRPHQGKAIVRGTMQPLLLAHEVGTGKTFTLISTAMEMRRLGTARKPMIVVQNATVGQFVRDAKALYPNAKILTLEDADRGAEGRKNFYAKIRYNDWDMIVVPQSTFEFIPDSEERQMAFVKDKIEEKMLVLEKMKEADTGGNDIITRQAEKEIASLELQLAELSDQAAKKRSASDEKKRAVTMQNAEVKAQEMLDRRTDDVENFDEMGIDALLVDEAHEYKHLGFATAMQRGVKGVDPSYSKKSQGVYLKTQAVLEKNNGRNVIFATGTPISNTAAEIWTFMRYLMPADTMKDYGIYYFDDFVRNFGNIQQMLEFTTSGKFKENNRFAGYMNLPELVRIWSGVSDTVLTREAVGVQEKIPELEGGKAQDIYLPQTRALRGIMKFVKAELERYEEMSGKQKKENSHIPLTMYGIAKAAAVDARLVQADAEDDTHSKTNEAVRQTLRSLKETESYKGTIAIFADNYQNKQSGFNLYEDIREKLIAEGVPAEQIVVMKSGMTVKKKLDIFEKVNHGEVRVILGSTFTLGTGVNIQERLHTLIHLDAPNRPMDYTQRNGRILRQGNLHKDMNKPVRVLRFGVEDSLDVTAYQRLKTKGAIADSIMNGKQMMANSMTNRVLEEEEDVFGDTVAQLSGSEYAMLKNNAEKNVRKYASRKKQWEADQTYIHNAKPRLNGLIADAEKRKAENDKSLKAVREAFKDGKFKEIVVGKSRFATVDDMADLFKEHNKAANATIKSMKEDASANKQTRELSVSLGGYTFKVKTEFTKDMTRSGASLFAEVHRTMTYSCPELGLENVPVKQSLLRNAIEDITENVITGRDFAELSEAADRSIQHYQSELEQISSREGVPFEYEEELAQAQKQLEEYTKLMKEDLAEKEAKYAEMDAEVQAAENLSSTEEDDEVLYRNGDGSYTDEEMAYINDPISKVLGYSRYTPKQQKKWAEKERGRMRNRVGELAKKLGIEIEVLDDGSSLEGRKARAKGFFDTRTGKITVVIGNHSSRTDVEKTVLHEAVAHYGLRKLFGTQFDTFLDNVYANAEEDIRYDIAKMAARNGWDFRTATEEYLAGLAENTDFENTNASWWHRIKSWFLEVLHNIGFEGFNDVTLTDNELRYILWRSYENLREPGGRRSIFGVAADVAKQYELKVGNYAEAEAATEAEAAEAGASSGIEAVNARFNEELEQFTEDNADNFKFSLGYPSAKLLSAGVENRPIRLHGSKVAKKMKKHGFSASELRNLPEAVANPIAVFDNLGRRGNRSVLTELRTENGNFLVTIDLGKGSEADFDIVSSVFGKKDNSIVTWINKGYAQYIDKEKALNYLHLSAPIAEASDNPELVSAAKIIENFENPRIPDENNSDDGILFRDGEEEGRALRTAREIYDDAVMDTGDKHLIGGIVTAIVGGKEGRKRFKHKFAEANFDYTRSVKQLQDAIREATGRRIEGFENVWYALNRKSSVDQMEINYVMSELIEPLAKHMGTMVRGKKLDGKRIKMDDVEMYMNAKHAPERNARMGKRWLEEQLESVRQSARANAIAEGKSEAEADVMAEAAANESYEKLAHDARRDYSGLTEMFSKEAESTKVEDLERAATEYVDAFEALIGEEHIKKLWDMVHALNAFTLQKSYDCGLISREQKEETEEMYQWYVPLRGWHDNYAGDVYHYITRDVNPEVIESAMKRAYGRKSRAGQIFGTMAVMANSAIVVGNKNKIVGNTLFNLAQNHRDSGLLAVSETWYEKDSDGKWTYKVPDYVENLSKMTHEKALEAQEAFEQKQREKEKAGTAVVRRYRSLKKNLGLNMEKWQVAKHGVRVMRGGKEYVIYIVGDPKAAQAINGDLDRNLGHEEVFRYVRAYMRFRAQTQTSWSLHFMIKNLQRDFWTASMSMGIKFGAKQEGQFIKEIAQLLPGISLAGDAGGSTIDRSAGIWNLFYRDRKGKLDMNNEVDRYFKEFLDNGGRTGISTLSRKDEYEGSMETLMKRTTYGDWNLARRGMKGLADQVEKANDGIENATRFAVYMVRRRNGASVAEAIFDAKEASVNFNMRGSGAWGNAYLRTFYLYSNPALQSLRMVGTWYASDPTATTGALIRHGARVGARRLTGAAALTFAASFALAWACAGWGGDDDDESAWYGLSDWQRYNYVNIPIPGGGRKFLTWSIPQEMRPVWALAQISFDHMTGRITGERAAKSALVQLNNYSPVTLVDGGVRHEPTDSYAKTFIKAWTPTIAEDVLDAYLWKEDFLGRRIGYRTENNEYSPEWQRVDDNTPKWLVELSRGWNNLTGGRNNRRSGWVNEAFNPSAIWFIAEQQGGGFYDIIKKFAVCADMVLSGEADEIELRDTPFASALMVDAGTDQSRQRVVNDRYWMLRGEYETAKHEIQLIRREQREGSRSPEEIAKDISAMYEDGSFTNWEVFNSYEKDYKRLRKYADAAEESGDKAALKHWNSLIFDMKRIVLKDIEKRDALRSGEDATGLNAELEAMKSDFRTKVESWKQGD